ncbi:MAG: sialate O-acetylesterase [Planctomycetota bacterium]
MLIRFTIWLLPFAILSSLAAQDDSKTLRVFVFAGQSNMVGSDSSVAEVDRYPPFVGAAAPQPKVRFWYVLGREDKRRSKGWTALQPVDDIVGPELSFAREVAAHTKAPLAIVKVAAGGTTLGNDWNPDHPGGFELYPLALSTVREALADLDHDHVKWRLEGFFWHQGENDMFDDAFRKAYADNLAHFFACWRRDLNAPQLHFYVGELCTKTIWGMDNREPMDAIARAQHQVTAADPLADYVPTSHVGVTIGGDGGLHYHYGTLGQLEHGVNHARAYLRSIGIDVRTARPLAKWPYADGATVDLYVLAGHRNMEGERAFVPQLDGVKGGRDLAKSRVDIAFRYSIGGGVQTSDGWEPLGPAGFYDTFGPELSFGRKLAAQRGAKVAIAKFTHSGSQIVDWTPEGSAASARNLYPAFLAFVRDAIADLEHHGQKVRLAGIVYHLGENDMSFGPHRRQAAKWLGETIAASRHDLGMPELRWYVSQQRPTASKDLDKLDVVHDVAALAVADPNLIHVEVFDPPPQAEQLVFDTAGVVWLGERVAEAVLSAGR